MAGGTAFQAPSSPFRAERALGGAGCRRRGLRGRRERLFFGSELFSHGSKHPHLQPHRTKASGGDQGHFQGSAAVALTRH